MSNNEISIADYATNKMKEAKLPIEAYSIIVEDIDNATKDSVDKRIDLLTKVMNQEKSKAIAETEARLTAVTKEEFAKMGYQERLNLYKNNRDLYERLVK